MPSARFANGNTKLCGSTHFSFYSRTVIRAYKNLMRMDYECTYEELLRIVSPFIVKKDTFMREAIPVNQQLSTTLRYLATGNSFEDMKFTTAISSISISKIVIHCLKEYIKTPQTQDASKQIAKGFNRWNFPNCLGAVDGKHAAIKKTPHSGTLDYTIKGF